MRAVVVATILALSLTGPVAAQVYGGNDRLRQQVEDYRLTVGQSVGIGTTIGAVVGLGVGVLTRQRSPLVSGLIGGVVGSLVGAISGDVVASQKRQQFQAESRLNDQIVRLRQSNAKLAGIVQVTDRLIVQRRQELAALRDQAWQTRAQLRSALSEDRQLVQAALDSAIRARDDLDREVRARGGGSMDKNISRLSQQRRALDTMERSL